MIAVFATGVRVFSLHHDGWEPLVGDLMRQGEPIARGVTGRRTGLTAPGIPQIMFVSRTVFALPCVLLAGSVFAQPAKPVGDDPSATVGSAPAPPHDGQGTDEGDPSNRTQGKLTVPQDRLQWHIPDPAVVEEMSAVWLEDAQKRSDDTALTADKRVAGFVLPIRRPQKVRLGLEEALHRALASSYDIEVESYNPAMATTAIVTAEAAFDASFFANITKNKVDRPSGSQLTSTNLDNFTSTYGITKLLPTGAQITGQFSLNRTKTSLSFQQLNPEYFSSFVVQVQQPLLRGFGLDVNLAQTRIRKKQRDVDDMTFRIQVRETLRNVEQLYWALLFARRDVVITARLVAAFEAIYEYLVARQSFDITPVQLAATKSRLEASRFQFVRVKANVRDAQDRLIAAMNDPAFNLADEIEIIPTTFPDLTRVPVDRLAEIQVAIESSPEIKQQQLGLDISKIQVGQAKNGELPQLDLTLQYTVDGIGNNADIAFDELTRNNFIEYFVGVQLNVPIGNRSARAAHHSARLALAQATARLKRTFEQIILSVNTSVRNMETAFAQIPSTFESVEATRREVESLVARAERRDLNTLNSELNSRQNLVSARRAMLNAMIDYNMAIVDLERSKGTLLRYYHITIDSDVDSK